MHLCVCPFCCKRSGSLGGKAGSLSHRACLVVQPRHPLPLCPSIRGLPCSPAPAALASVPSAPSSLPALSGGLLHRGGGRRLPRWMGAWSSGELGWSPTTRLGLPWAPRVCRGAGRVQQVASLLSWLSSPFLPLLHGACHWKHGSLPPLRFPHPSAAAPALPVASLRGTDSAFVPRFLGSCVQPRSRNLNRC